MIKKIYLLCGCPGSGKSTYAKAHIDDKSAWISRDKIRFSMVSEDEEYFSKEKEVFNAFIKEIKKAIMNDLIENIYIDATHINEASRNNLLDKILWSVRDELNVIYFDTPLDICLKRNSNRSGRERVPDSVITRMFKSSRIPTNNEKYKYKNIIIVNE
jgi:predicted kinase